MMRPPHFMKHFERNWEYCKTIFKNISECYCSFLYKIYKMTFILHRMLKVNSTSCKAKVKILIQIFQSINTNMLYNPVSIPDIYI